MLLSKKNDLFQTKNEDSVCYKGVKISKQTFIVKF